MLVVLDNPLEKWSPQRLLGGNHSADSGGPLTKGHALPYVYPATTHHDHPRKKT